MTRPELPVSRWRSVWRQLPLLVALVFVPTVTFAQAPPSTYFAIRSRTVYQKPAVRVLGPAPAPLALRRGRYRQRLRLLPRCG